MILMKICYVIYYMCHVLKTVEHNTNYPSRIKNPFLIVFIQIMEYKVYIIIKKKVKMILIMISYILKGFHFI